eukprot:TRINITY_DN3140_c1_g1_i9.p2 TRINITY_DN3140_c1_g1~~TRINITY_DN3140_c1_g1_i9.p2  ORF type:complete len:152 (+),score=41.66 TRINITY_DN3140_c1_g1_i9:78-533(+)
MEMSAAGSEEDGNASEAAIEEHEEQEADQKQKQSVGAPSQLDIGRPQQQQQQGQGLPDAQPQLVAVDPQFYGGGPFVNCSQPQTVMVPVDPALAAAGAQPQSAQPQGTVLVPVLFSAAPQLMPTVFMAPTMQQPLPYVLSAPQVSFEPGST